MRKHLGYWLLNRAAALIMGPDFQVLTHRHLEFTPHVELVNNRYGKMVDAGEWEGAPHASPRFLVAWKQAKRLNRRRAI